jgi:hypothetical protein
MICSGPSGEIGAKERLVLNSPWGSRMSTERNGTAGNPVLCQTDVCETISAMRFSLPYQLLNVMVLQSVLGSSATTERLGSLSPLRRGLPI